MTLPEVIAKVLGDRALRQTELAVAILEAGYETTTDAKALRNAVGVELRGGRFQRGKDGRWRCHVGGQE